MALSKLRQLSTELVMTDKVQARSGSGLYLVDDGDNGLFIADGGCVFLGDTSNAKMTFGLTINQGAHDDEILALKSSDVAHGVTDVTETDTYFRISKGEASGGAPKLQGLTAGDFAIFIDGIVTLDKTAKSAAGCWGVINLDAAKKSGTGVGGLGADANLVVIRDNLNARAIFDVEGELHLDATLSENAWDSHDDLALLTAVRHAVLSPQNELKGRTRDLFERHRKVLEDAGVITVNDGEGEDGSVFLAMKQWSFLLADAVRQLGARVQECEQSLVTVGAQPRLLEA